MRMYKRKYKTNLIYKLCSWQALFRITCVMNTTFVKILKQLKQQNTLKKSISFICHARPRPLFIVEKLKIKA